MTSSFVLSIILTATSWPVLTWRASLTTAKWPLPNVRPRWYSPLRSERPGLHLGSRCPSWAVIISPELSMFKIKRGLGREEGRGRFEVEGFRGWKGIQKGIKGKQIVVSRCQGVRCHLAVQRKDITMRQNDCVANFGLWPKGKRALDKVSCC